MALTVKHHYVTTQPDNADPNSVSADEWNANHDITGTVGFTDIDQTAAYAFSALGNTTITGNFLQGTYASTLRSHFTVSSAGVGAANHATIDLIDTANVSSNAAVVPGISGWGSNYGTGTTGRVWYVGSDGAALAMDILFQQNGPINFFTNGVNTTSITAAGALTNTQSIAATSTDGFLLTNTTAAAAGAQQWSPRLHLTGQGWKTTATAASQAVDWIVENQPVQGAAAPSTNLVFSSQVNGAGYVSNIVLAPATFSIGGATDKQILTFGGIQTAANIGFIAGSSTSAGLWLGRADAPTTLFVGFNTTYQVSMPSDGQFGFSSVNHTGDFRGQDVILNRLGPAILGFGGPASATPAAYTVSGQPSRAGTDSNVGGANLAVTAGNGTGTGTLSSLVLQSPVAVASGSSAQTQTTGLTIKGGCAVRPSYTVSTLPAAATVGAGAMAWVTDATATTFLSTVAGGGANKVPVSSDGTNWLIG